MTNFWRDNIYNIEAMNQEPNLKGIQVKRWTFYFYNNKWNTQWV